MDLQTQTEQFLELLKRFPALENRAGLAKTVAALRKTFADFEKLAEPETVRDSKEYGELLALINLPENKNVVNADWFTAQGKRVGSKTAKFTAKKAKDDLLLELVRQKHAATVIQELKSTPQQRDQKLLSQLANLPAERAEKDAAKLKPAELEAFCAHNQIAVERNKRGGFDKKKTLVNIAEKLAELREYLKM